MATQIRKKRHERPRKANRQALARRHSVPALPPRDAEGNYPAEEALDVIVARQVIRRRQALGWTQAELAHRAQVRPETLSRLETGKHAPNIATIDKIDRALRAAGA